MSNTSVAPSKGHGIVFPTAVLCLLFSGLAGLIYQVVWTRYLALLTGHTSYAIVAVLAAFMGGLALGNAWLGRTADKLRRPLAFYGWLEIIIGVYALAFPDIFRLAYGAYTGAATGAAAGSASLLAMKFLVALFTLIIPTVLMGGTLPVLTRMVTRSLGELQNRVSTLYFVNSIGAVFGVGLAEFWLIPDTGLPGTLTYGAAINLAVGALALFVSGYIREEAVPVGTPDSAKTKDMETFTSPEIRMAVIGIGVSGFVAMLYEIAWTRLLGLTMGSTSGAFAIMLITFILGIALGSWIIGRLGNIRNSLDWFAWMEIAIGGSVILMMFLYSRLPYWFSLVAQMLKREESVYPVFQTFEGLFSFAVMIVPTTILGMTLPLVSRISTAEVSRTGRSVGFVFSFNTLGAVLGTIVTGLWALPALGLAQTFALGTGLNIAVGLIILARNAAPAQKKLVPLVLPGVVLWIVLAQSLFHKEWATLTTSGAYRMRGTAAESFEAYRELNQQPKLLFHRDGASATVTVKEFPKNHLFLQVNGKTDASTGTDMLTQLMLGHVPALLHPDPKDALVIGLGSGVTCGALLTHSGFTNVDVVEICPEVVEAARYFGPVNENVLTNELLTLHVDDAKSFLNTAQKKYDIIISEPSNPWMAGVPGLFSVEFYRQAASRLESEGIMCQWLHMYEISQEGVDTIIATFTDTFRYTSIWLGSAGDLLLVGGTQPREAELESVLRRSGQPRVRASLARGDILRPVTLLAHELVSEDYSAYAFKEDTLLHSDLYPVLESLAQKGSFVGAETRGIFDYDERRTLRPNSLLAQYKAKHPLEPGDWLSLITHNEYETILSPELARSITSEWSLKTPKDPNPIMLGAMYKDDRKPTASDVAVMSFKLGDIVADPRRNVEWTVRFAYSAMMNYRFGRSVFHTPQSDTLVTILEKLIETFPDEAHIYNTYLAELAWDSGDQNKFLRLAADVFIRQGHSLALSSFPDGERAPAIVLTRLIEYFLENPDPEKLTHLIQVSERAGFASPEAPRLQAAVGRAKYVTPPPNPARGQAPPGSAPGGAPPMSPLPGKQ
jgi:spermidine synthase